TCLLSFFFSSRRRHTRWPRDWSSDVCSSDLGRTPDRREPDNARGIFAPCEVLPPPVAAGVIEWDGFSAYWVERLGKDVLVVVARSEEHTSELQSRGHLVCRLLLEKKKKTKDR